GDPSLDAGARGRVIDALFDATSGDGPGITDPDTVAGLLDRAGVDGAALVAAAGAPAAKDRLRRATEDALAAGVFGVPTMIADGELFWGDDSLDDLDRFLAGDDPIDQAALAAWADLPAAAQRRRS
ncbi:MAG: DsbA family protein, partial [Myxococcales bacterium]|nr:DsbA family protein [Myxococcales bacterium]